MACVLTAIVWESVFVKQSSQQQLAAFEKRLHQEEKQVDDKLMELKRGQEPDSRWCKSRGVIILGFREGQLFYWSDERVGTPDLYHALQIGKHFVKVNNTYYDVRKIEVENTEYYALIFLKDDYPITNKYIRNRVNHSLGVNLENADQIIIHDVFDQDGIMVHNQEGERLFQVANDIQYENRLPNYFIFVLYILALYLVFYAYKLVLVNTSSLRLQLLWVVLFISLFAGVWLLVAYYKVPYSLHHIPLFQPWRASWALVQPIGNIFLSLFCLVHFFYFTLLHVQIKHMDVRLLRYRYLFLFAFLMATFLYINFIHYSIDSLIDNTQVSLNVARIVNLDFSSVMAFVTSIMGIMGLLVLVNGCVRYFYNLFSMKELLIALPIICVIASWLCYVFNLSLSPAECLFTLAFYVLLIINTYRVKGEARKSMFIVAIVMVSGYITDISKNREMHREQAVRSFYANEIISERDALFEVKLVELSEKIHGSKELDSLVYLQDREAVTGYIFRELMDLTGYRYDSRVAFISGLERGKVVMGDRTIRINDPGWLLDSLNLMTNAAIVGIPVEESSFYNIDCFDGITTYLGFFSHSHPEGELTLCLRFDSKIENERMGYQQILSMVPHHVNAIVYPYSYAKYKNGELLTSRGSFNYYRRVEQFDKSYPHVKTIEKDGYSHMLIPVEESGLFVISLGRGYFAPYGLNILYAIVVCLLLSSYGVFFRFDREVRDEGKGGTLRKRIKNSIVGLLCVLLLLTTAMSVMMTSFAFERRQSFEVVRLSKYITQELEKYDCVDMGICPDIESALASIADVVQVDINVYNAEGVLVSASVPTIFTKGFDGTLLNPDAKRNIIDREAASFVQEEQVGELKYMATYLPLELKDGKKYVLCIPYFAKSDELNRDIVLFVVISGNIAMIVIVLAFFLSGVVAERVTKPLQLLNEKLRLMQVGGKNEKIVYNKQDEVGALVKEYNNMVDVLDENIKKLSKAERESAWREMARQIAHEIKNPLTPMKLNIQFLQRAMQGGDVEETRRRFEEISAVLVEQIDHMAMIATAFSDFAKVSVTNNELFNFSEVVEGCARLFENNVEHVYYHIEPDLFLYGDKEQVNRVLVNLLKNAEQSIPEGRSGKLLLNLRRKGKRILFSIQDNGIGIPDSIKDRIAEPNFTTKSGGMGLGLALSYRIVEGMGGNIWFASRENEGTIFYVSLKYVKV